MISFPKKTFSAWIRQKRRHLSTGYHYSFSVKFLLGTYAASQLGFYIGFVALLCVSPFVSLAPPHPYLYYGIVFLVFLVRLVSLWVVFSKSSQKLGEKGLLWVYPWAEIFFCYFYAHVGIFKLVGQKTKMEVKRN